MDRKIVLILLTVVFIAAAATSPELELIVMAGESQNNAEICIEEDPLDLKNTKANNTQVKNRYEAEDSAAADTETEIAARDITVETEAVQAESAAVNTETKAAARDIAVENEAEVQVKSVAGNTETEAAETSGTRAKTAENKTIKQTYSDNCWSFMAAILPTQSLTLNIDNGSYYANLPTDIKVGWIKIGSTWNYFDTSGRMLI